MHNLSLPRNYLLHLILPVLIYCQKSDFALLYTKMSPWSTHFIRLKFVTEPTKWKHWHFFGLKQHYLKLWGINLWFLTAHLQQKNKISSFNCFNKTYHHLTIFKQSLFSKKKNNFSNHRNKRNVTNYAI